ncbi:TylF/MycF/NovP-related O-methyltransferase [Mucisphaera calidilacus]|uniref:Macrocin O-methyltransferase n=1 Tax=Mucisphaera calidilacus TaxID=2527982 RepID=A0A518BXJ3_9BACT|nr:TylF/MycF/NovP-related O-methyltransferase [Mucisphaera calidilacus]QDU71676.1 Macrocin O-methyltransferase [Mucisphaera calidilacus]
MLNRLRRRCVRTYKRLTAPRVITNVRAEAITYLEDLALIDLTRFVRQLERTGVQGDLIEAGCALGGSAIVIAHAKQPDRTLRVYDVFGMIPPPSDKDGQDVHERYEVISSGQSEGLDGQEYYGYRDNLLDEVRSNFNRHGIELERHNVHLVKGLFQDTMNFDQPIALAHVDGDWYESVRTCLDRISPHLAPGGRIVIDDYEAYTGCRTAVDEFMQQNAAKFRTEQHARLHIVRNP